MTAASPLSAGGLAQLTFSLLAVVALIVALSWALKRFKFANFRARGDIAVLDELSLGPRDRVVLVRVGDAQVLLGIGSGGMVALTPLSAPIALAGGNGAPTFADRLREMMKRAGNPS